MFSFFKTHQSGLLWWVCRPPRLLGTRTWVPHLSACSDHSGQGWRSSRCPVRGHACPAALASAADWSDHSQTGTATSCCASACWSTQLVQRSGRSKTNVLSFSDCSRYWLLSLNLLEQTTKIKSQSGRFSVLFNNTFEKHSSINFRNINRSYHTHSIWCI